MTYQEGLEVIFIFPFSRVNYHSNSSILLQTYIWLFVFPLAGKCRMMMMGLETGPRQN